jgi:hypothetical protein
LLLFATLLTVAPSVGLSRAVLLTVAPWVLSAFEAPSADAVAPLPKPPLPEAPLEPSELPLPLEAVVPLEADPLMPDEAELEGLLAEEELLDGLL